MSVISLSKKLSLLVALSITATTVSLPAKAWLVKNKSSEHYIVMGKNGGPFGKFFVDLYPGQTAACNAAEKACGAGGWAQLCVENGPHNKTTNGYEIQVYGGMGVTIYDDKVKTVRNEKFIDDPDVQLGEIYKIMDYAKVEYICRAHDNNP